LRKDFDKLAFNADETSENFSIRISAIISKLQSLGDKISKLDGVQNILRVVPARYVQMACSIETLLDLERLKVGARHVRVRHGSIGRLSSRARAYVRDEINPRGS
jgi:hypothetical protein